MGQFNEEQAKAIEAPFGPLAVIAGPGSGKTRVTTARAARLIVEQGVPAYNILLVTFTNIAAGEMKKRLMAEAGDAASGVACGTMHSQILKYVLREFPECPPMKRRGLGDKWSVLNTDDRAVLLKQVEPKLSGKARAFMSENSASVDELASVISLSKNWGFSREQLTAKLKPSHPKFELYQCALELWRLYDAELRVNRVVDFDDILTIGAEAVTECDWIRDSLANRFQHIFVDEYQDTNAIQFRFLKAIAAKNRNLYVVGDPKQAIYGFRGSMPTIFTLFFDAFPEAAVVNLNKNYRSNAGIVGLTNKLIASMPDRLAEDHDLVSMTEAASFDPGYVQYSSDIDEADGVVEQMLKCRDNGHGWGDMAVLYRKNASRQAIEKALLANNIPYVVSNDKAMFERRDMRDLMAFLRAAWQPWDKLAFRRLVKNFSLGVTEQTFLKVVAEHNGVIADAIETLCQKRTKNIEALTTMRDQMSSLRRQATAAAGDSVSQIMDSFIDAHVMPKFEGKEDAGNAAKERLGMIRNEVRRLIDGEMDPRDILARFALMETNQSSKSDHAIKLMTVHGSKGLEFPVVFCVSADDETMPGGNVDREQDLNEERRILFVAITRAKDELYLSSAKRRRQHNMIVKCDPCRFLYDINMVKAECREGSSLTDNPAFSKLPPIKIQNPDAAPSKRPGRGKIDPETLEQVQRDPNFNKLMSRFNATVLMCMPAGGRSAPPVRRGIESS